MDGIQILTEKETKLFDITPDDIYDMLSPPNPTHYFGTIGGPEGMAKLLKSDLVRGLNIKSLEPAIEKSEEQTEKGTGYGVKRRNSIVGTTKATPVGDTQLDNTEARKAHFGTNTMPEAISRSVWSFILDALNDKILIMLIVAAVAEIAIGIYKTTKGSAVELIDGVAIALAGM
jgi:Ca2+-transporting ATPase